MKKEKNYAFALKSIKTEQFAIIEDCFKNGEKVELNSNVGFAADKATTTIAIFTGFRFEQNNIPFLLIETSCYFQIGEANWNTFSNNASLIMPKGFMQQLLSLAIGTARGVLHSKTENSTFNRFVLPILDAANLIKEDVVLDLETALN
jgi:hypothetical protein